MGKSIIYCRSNHCYENQKSILESNLIRNGIDPRSMPTYSDIGSGNKWDRAGFQMMIADIINGNIDSVYVSDYSTLWRNVQIGIITLKIFNQFNTEIILVEGNTLKPMTPNPILTLV